MSILQYIKNRKEAVSCRTHGFMIKSSQIDQCVCKSWDGTTIRFFEIVLGVKRIDSIGGGKYR
jgi:hypothetical protein